MNGGRERSNGHPRSYEEEEEKEEERWKEEELAGMPVALLTFTPELTAFMAEVRPHASQVSLILLYISSLLHTVLILLILPYVSAYYYVRVLIPLCFQKCSGVSDD